MERIVAVDPGQTTGWAEGTYNPVTREWAFRDAIEIAWEDRFLMRLLLASSNAGEPLLPPTHIVCEQFTLYKNKAQDQVGSHFPSVRVIGTLEAYLDELGILCDLKFQGASVRDRVAILPEHYDKLKGSEHKKDAYQHLRYFCVANLKAKLASVGG